MASPLIAIVGDVDSKRTFTPPMNDPATAKKAAEELGTRLAQTGARLLVYGGPFLEADVVRGFVAGKPGEDRCIIMWYTQGNAPPPFPEESSHPRLFERRIEQGGDWETAFYRSVTRADGVILIGGQNATKISGQIAIGARMPILSLREFGGGAAQVWETLSAGEDLPNRDEINLMAQPWADSSAAACVKALLAQHERRRFADGPPRTIFPILAACLFILAVAIVAGSLGKNDFYVWMLVIAPLLAGGAGAAIRPAVDYLRGSPRVAGAVLATVVLGLIAGGIAYLLLVVAQLTANPELNLASHPQRSIPLAVGIGFVAGLTADAVFGKLLGVDVVRTTGLDVGVKRPS